MIKIWTTSNNAHVLDLTIGQSMRELRPNVPPHKVIQLNPQDVPYPEKGEVVLACGKQAVQLLAQQGVWAKNRTPNSLRQSVFPTGMGGAFMATLDPFRCHDDPGDRILLGWDIRLASRYLRTGSLDPQTGSYKFVGSYAPMIERIKKQYEKTGQRVDLAGDLETMGLTPFAEGKRIVSISFTLEEGTAELVYTGPNFESPVGFTVDGKELRAQIEWLLTSDMISSRWANGKFDMIWLMECWGMYCENFRFDACLVGSLLEENRSCSLNILTKAYVPALGGYDDDFNKKFDKSKFDEIVPDETYATYAGGDTDATQRLSTKLKSEILKLPALARFYTDLLHPAARTFEHIESRGVKVNQEKLEVLRDDLKKEVTDLREQALESLPRRLRLKFLDAIEKQQDAGKNPMTPKLKGEYFFGELGLKLKPKMKTEKTGVPSTAANHFEMFYDTPEAAQMGGILKRLGVAEKTLSTYVEGFMKHIRSDGKLHPSYFLFHGSQAFGETHEGGTVTGRLSAIDPAFQTLPKHSFWAKRIRECYDAAEGWMTFEVDFSQGELRVAACVAPDRKMIEAYKNGMDLHSVTGALAAQVEYDYVLSLKNGSSTDKKLAKSIRQKGKAGNFGLLYGMRPKGFQAYARTSYGVEMSLQEATEFRDKFLYEQWTGLPAYHDNMEKFVKQNSYVVSPLGRIRHLPHVKSMNEMQSMKAVLQAINSPVQSTLSDMMLLALTLLEQEFPQDELQVVGTIHDAAVGYVREDKAVELMQAATQIMGNLPLQKFDWNPELDFPADWSLGPHFGAMYEEGDLRGMQAAGQLPKDMMHLESQLLAA
jgi:DNA polymerase I-like protein with 3'-5' exonuclease and polymerase domains